MTAVPVFESERLRALDELVDELCLTLQISATQFEEAKQHYEAVGDWLAREGSPIAGLSPVIYPQGGMALLTTVKPRTREEYDLDLVLQLMPWAGGPMELYNLVRQRLEEHRHYRGRLELMKRCLRLKYANQFHLDILPARQDDERGGTCIEVPDRKLHDWKPSNPIGYVRWFHGRCEMATLAKAERDQTPLPTPIPDYLLRPLRRSVQLMKRRRDNEFRGSDLAPRSVVLTTLAGEFYQGQDSVVHALEQILATIEHAIDAAHPRQIEVRNPTNQDELFSESWAEGEGYEAFADFIRKFRAEVTALRGLEGLHNIGVHLDVMFGDGLGARAVRAFVEKFGHAKEAGGLRFGTPGIVAGYQGRRPARNTFHHGA